MSIEAVMSSNHLILLHLLLLPSIFPKITNFYNKSAVCIRWPKGWSFIFSICPSNEYSELIYSRIDWFDLLAVQGLLRIFSNTTIQKQKFFEAQPSLRSNSHLYMTIGKIIALTFMGLCWESDASSFYYTEFGSFSSKEQVSFNFGFWSSRKQNLSLFSLFPHHQLNGHEFEQAPEIGDGQGSLTCCSPWGHKESDTTNRLNWTDGTGNHYLSFLHAEF